MGAMLMCDMGIVPASLTPTPNMVTAGGVGAATIMDFVPMENISTFGMCMCPANPEVAAATASALGVLTPMPCIPMTTAPWTPGSPTVTIGDMPALTADSTCMCDWGGMITISDPGQTTVMTAG
jgi:hypothetical protein